ncbi:SpoIIE family protein phosphatase [Streptomyces caniscabiei]|nr:SpoIIE family protein phosphatase [Streptomyces caniscabiei]
MREGGRGDVGGHGIQAPATMGRMRTAVRILAECHSHADQRGAGSLGDAPALGCREDDLRAGSRRGGQRPAPRTARCTSPTAPATTSI